MHFILDICHSLFTVEYVLNNSECFVILMLLHLCAVSPKQQMIRGIDETVLWTLICPLSQKSVVYCTGFSESELLYFLLEVWLIPTTHRKSLSNLTQSLTSPTWPSMKLNSFCLLWYEVWPIPPTPAQIWLISPTPVQSSTNLSHKHAWSITHFPINICPIPLLEKPSWVNRILANDSPNHFHMNSDDLAFLVFFSYLRHWKQVESKLH